MLYLEDYLEMIENLPMEMRDRFTEMREMDLQVENAMDSLEEKVKAFFKKCGTVPNLKPEWKHEQMDKIKQEYHKALEDADEKVQLANQIYELVERHLRKLDQEVAKFKMELEADNAGITEILERRAAEAEKQQQPINNHRMEKRKYSSLNNHTGSKLHTTTPSSDKMLTQFPDMAREALLSVSKTSSSAASSPATAMFDSKTATSISYNLGQVGAGSNAAIAAAASRAIEATLEMPQGRRTASLKASYEAVGKSVDLSKQLTIGRELGRMTSSTGSTTAADPGIVATKSASRNKKSGVRSQALATPLLSEVAPPIEPLDVTVDETTGSVVSTAWQIDPNEPRYCVCNDVSYGDMVGCDNDDCPIEWFHYGCVGLTQAPRGKWYCPQCLAAMKRRGRK